ncbi:MAG: hypothetical protein C0397_11575 [Odoribacter sp.]|nr:hypothetical protein [Odoribacter sp.]
MYFYAKSSSMLRFILSLLCFSITGFAFGQLRISEAEILIQSRHIWRGSQLGDAFAIEPTVTLEMGRFIFNFWAAVTPDNSYSEVDLIPSWTFDHFSLSLLNYYNPVSGDINQYLNFREGKSRHSLELTIDNFSVEKSRLKWMAGTFLAGDRNKETGKPFYSTYLEFKYPFTILIIEAEPFVGLTPFQSFYADRFAVINAGISFSKELDLKLPFIVPLCLSFISNPNTQKNFIVFAVGIAF